MPFSVLAVTMADCGVRSFERGREPHLRTREMFVPRRVCTVRHPRGSYVVYLRKRLQRETKQFIRRRYPHVRKLSTARAVLDTMHLDLHATRLTPDRALSLVYGMLPGRHKPAVAPSRYFRGAKVYGHMTAAMHGTSTPLLLLMR